MKRKIAGKILKSPSLFIFHLGKKTTSLGQIKCLPWQDGLKELGL